MNEIASPLASRPSILSLDWGQKKIGVAVLPATINVPVPLGILENNNKKDILEHLIFWVKEYQVDKIIIGLPISLSGQEGAQAETVRNETMILQELGLPLEFVDERFSSQSGGISAKLAGVREDDAYAAVQLLEKFL